jgi:FkbM family methyltransferase
VGANVGLWTRTLADEVIASSHLDSQQVRVYAFEPASSGYRALLDRAARLPLDAHVQQLALSNFEGRRELYIVGEASGVNSFHPPPDLGILRTEDVPVTTLDRFACFNGIHNIDAVKVDAEGEDMAVLEGAQKMLEAHRIGLVQFEYNHRWISARRFLKDAFDLLLGCGYGLGKLTRNGWEEYRHWYPVLENYREANLLALNTEWRDVIPHVEWWGRRRYGD